MGIYQTIALSSYPLVCGVKVSSISSSIIDSAAYLDRKVKNSQQSKSIFQMGIFWSQPNSSISLDADAAFSRERGQAKISLSPRGPECPQKILLLSGWQCDSWVEDLLLCGCHFTWIFHDYQSSYVEDIMGEGIDAFPFS